MKRGTKYAEMYVVGNVRPNCFAMCIAKH